MPGEFGAYVWTTSLANHGFAGALTFTASTAASSVGPAGGAHNRQFPTAITLRAFPVDAVRGFPVA